MFSTNQLLDEAIVCCTTGIFIYKLLLNFCNILGLLSNMPSKYPLKRSMLFLAAAFALSLHHASPSFPPALSTISMQDEMLQRYRMLAASKKNGLNDLAIPLSPEMSREDIQESIIRLIIYRAESQIKEILAERRFELYDPFSELPQLEKKLKNSYNKTGGLTKLLAPKKFIRVRNEFCKVQNSILEGMCADVANGKLEQLSNSILSSYYKDAIGYDKLKEIYSDFYEMSISYLEKSKDKSETEKRVIEEKEELVKMLFEKENNYLKSVYSGT